MWPRHASLLCLRGHKKTCWTAKAKIRQSQFPNRFTEDLTIFSVSPKNCVFPKLSKLSKLLPAGRSFFPILLQLRRLHSPGEWSDRDQESTQRGLRSSATHLRWPIPRPRKWWTEQRQTKSALAAPAMMHRKQVSLSVYRGSWFKTRVICKASCTRLESPLRQRKNDVFTFLALRKFLKGRRFIYTWSFPAEDQEREAAPVWYCGIILCSQLTTLFSVGKVAKPKGFSKNNLGFGLDEVHAAYMRSLAPAVLNPHQLHQHRRTQVALLSLMRTRMEAPLSLAWLLRPRFLFRPSREHSVFMLTSPACQACRMWRKSCQVHWILTSMLLALTVMTRPAPCRAVESSGTRMSVLLW